jgi:DNA modification methylase
MRQMPAESVQSCVTSPPYWGLRDYGHSDQIGQEDSPEAFVQAMVEVFREVRRVLKADGTLWLNLGDTYAAGKAGRTDDGSNSASSTLGPNRSGLPNNAGMGNVIPRKAPDGYKPKDLVGIPWMTALALRADGWYLRQDIIWHKPNPMPESVTDRCTKAHEYVFLLTKSARYFYDAEAVKETVSGGTHGGAKSPSTLVGRNAVTTQGGKESSGLGMGWDKPERNRRSVWTVATQPFSGAHFATFPPALITPCIMAGTKPGDTVLDPFGGSGTTGMVALELGRKAILCELNPEYAAIIHQRTNVTPGLALT